MGNVRYLPLFVAILPNPSPPYPL